MHDSPFVRVAVEQQAVKEDFVDFFEQALLGELVEKRCGRKISWAVSALLVYRGGKACTSHLPPLISHETSVLSTSSRSTKFT